MGEATMGALENWNKLTYAYQIVEIGTETQRAMRYKRDGKAYESVYKLALKLFDLTSADSKNAEMIPTLNEMKSKFVDFMSGNISEELELEIADFGDSEMDNYIEELRRENRPEL